jgi:diguanylate cyclase (GGDEF)-like protein
VRPRIGVIAGWQFYEHATPNWFLHALLQGAVDAGRRRGCDVYLSCGIGARIEDPREARPGWPEARPDVQLVPIGRENTDGLVFVSPLRTSERRAYARRLQEDGFPVVFVGAGDGRPAVVADSARGFREALVHLQGHGHRRVAFVSGDPLDRGDSLERLDHFRALCVELGLELDERIVSPGLHSEHGGREAMRAILQTGRSFSAVLASNDMSAIGAMRALAEAGRRVPEDVAVVGFDDQPWARAHRPPLATVRYPLAEAGALAVERLLSLVGGAAASGQDILVPTRFVGRRSCGCLPSEDAGSAPPADAHGESPADLAAAVDRAVAAVGSLLAPPDRRLVCERLATGFAASLATGTAGPFEGALVEVLNRLEEAGDSPHRWQGALTALRAAPREPAACGWGEDLLHRGRLALSESAERAAARQRLLDSETADLVSALTVPLQSVQDEAAVCDLLRLQAPLIGLRPVCLAQYEDVPDWSVARVRWLGPGSSASEEVRLPSQDVLGARPGGTDEPCAIAVVPLARPDRTLGFFAFESADLSSGGAIALQIAVALESVRLQAVVRERTLTDELTGLHNRRHFDAELRREAERARRFGRKLALALVDVDRFKSYNDTFGHPAGDEALRQVGRHLAATVPRRLDAVARYGGEEFAVLLAETDAEGARVVAERLRAAVAGASGFRRPLTISVGVASLAGPGADADALVASADEALYRAKRGGRNRVCVAGGDGPPARGKA